MTAPATLVPMILAPATVARLAEARLARRHHGGMVVHYARAIRRMRRCGGGGSGAPERIGELLDEFRHHRRRHRVFNQYIWHVIKARMQA